MDYGLRRLLSCGLLLAMLAALLLGPTPESAAHALLQSADPNVNASLSESPEQITARFTEPLERGNFTALEVYNPSGGRVDTGGTIFNDADENEMSVELQQLEPAVYTVVWKTLSQVDGHTYVGSYTFTVLNPDGSIPQSGVFAFTGDTGAGGAPTWLDSIFKALELGGAVMLAGVFVFLAAIGLPATRALTRNSEDERRGLARLALAMAMVLVGVTMVGEVYLLIEQVNQLDGSGGVVDDVLFDTEFGRWLILRVVMLVVLFGLAVWLFKARSAALAQWIAIGGCIISALLLLGVSMVSHGAAAAQGSFWGTLSDFLHLVFASVWIGSLAFLALVWWTRRRRSAPEVWSRYFAGMLGRFSALAASSVVLVLATGITNAVIEIPSIGLIGDTDYGIAFIVKMVLVGVLFAVGAVNAVLLRPRVIADSELGPTQRRGNYEKRLGLVMGLEIAAALAVFGASGALTQLPTARVVDQQEANEPDLQTPERSAFTGEAPVDGGAMEVLINPARVGLNRVQVDLSGEIGEVTEVILELESETAGASQFEMPREDEDTFALEGSNLRPRRRVGHHGDRPPRRPGRCLRRVPRPGAPADTAAGRAGRRGRLRPAGASARLEHGRRHLAPGPWSANAALASTTGRQVLLSGRAGARSVRLLAFRRPRTRRGRRSPGARH